MATGEDRNRDWDESPSKLPRYDHQEMTLEEIEAKRAQLASEVASNYVVMKKVFGHLSSYDRWRCSGVNQSWRAWVLEPKNIWYYEIKVDEEPVNRAQPDRMRVNVFLTVNKAFVDNDKLIFSSIHAFNSAPEFLQALPDQREVRLIDSVFGRMHVRYAPLDRYRKPIYEGSIHKKAYEKLLSEIGSIVTTHRVVTSSFPESDFCLHLAKNFPNLRHLDLTSSSLSGSDESGDAYTPIPENQLLENLRTITIARIFCRSEFVVKLLKAAPNLTAIYAFPIKLVDALVITGKAGLVKSLDIYWEDLCGASQNPRFRNSREKTALQQLSELKITLSTFIVTRHSSHPEILPSVLRILQSSSASLTHLTMSVSRTPINLQVFSPLNALKSITFTDEFKHGPRYFREGTLLHQLFPNLTHVFIKDFRRLVSESVFWDREWGCKIKSLTLSGPKDFEYIVKIQEMFPKLMSLEFVELCSSNAFKSLLSAVSAKWPKIRHLSVCLDSSLMGPNCASNCSVDSALTAIPDEVLDQLKDPSREDFSNSKIQHLQRLSTIRKLSTLKSLKIKTSGEYLSISELSHEFGFQFLPYLKLIIETEDCHRGEWIKDVKLDLEHLMHLEIRVCKRVRRN